MSLRQCWMHTLKKPKESELLLLPARNFFSDADALYLYDSSRNDIEVINMDEIAQERIVMCVSLNQIKRKILLQRMMRL